MCSKFLVFRHFLTNFRIGQFTDVWDKAMQVKPHRLKKSSSITWPMVLQVSPQSQIFPNVAAHQMPNAKEQGIMSIVAEIGSSAASAQQSGRYSGSESSSANTAIRVQPSRGASLLTQSMKCICLHRRIHKVTRSNLVISIP